MLLRTVLAAACASVAAYKSRRPLKFCPVIHCNKWEVSVVDVNSSQVRPFFLWRHLNKLRWVTLTTVFLMLVAIPMLTIYQQYVAAHAYRLLTPGQQHFYDVMETLTSPFVRFPADDLDAIKGTTWSGQFFGWRLSDPLAVVAQISAGLELYIFIRTQQQLFHLVAPFWPSRGQSPSRSAFQISGAHWWGHTLGAHRQYVVCRGLPAGGYRPGAVFCYCPVGLWWWHFVFPRHLVV